MNTHTISESKEHNFIYYTKKSDESAPKISEMKNTGLQDVFDLDVMLPASTLHQYVKME